MPEHSLKKAMDTRLSGLRVSPEMQENALLKMRGEKIVKRKMALGLMLALLLLLAAVTAMALAQPDILRHLFGQGAAIPPGMESAVRKADQTSPGQALSVTLNEYLYDGEKLHLYWSISNRTGKQVMVTMSPLRVNEGWMYVEHETPLATDDHAWAWVLGGEADGVAMPEDISLYTAFANSRYTDVTLRQGGIAQITADLYIWEVLSPPVLVDPSAMEDFGTFEEIAALRRLPVEKNGFANLELFMYPGRDDIGTFNEASSRQAYAYMGWAKVASIQPVTFSVKLDEETPPSLEPVQATYEMEDFSLVISHLAYRQTGGMLGLKVYPRPEGAKVYYDGPLFRDLVVLDADTGAFLHGERSYTIQSEIVDDTHIYEYVEYQISLAPVSGKMPSAIIIAPSVYKYDGGSNSAARYARHTAYDPENAVRVELRQP